MTILSAETSWFKTTLNTIFQVSRGQNSLGQLSFPWSTFILTTLYLQIKSDASDQYVDYSGPLFCSDFFHKKKRLKNVNCLTCSLTLSSMGVSVSSTLGFTDKI